MLRRVQPIASPEETEASPDPTNQNDRRAANEAGPPNGIERRRHPRVRMDGNEQTTAAASPTPERDRRQGDTRSMAHLRAGVQWQTAPEKGNRLARNSFFQRFKLSRARLILLVVALGSGGLAAALMTQMSGPVSAATPVVEVPVPAKAIPEARTKVLVAKQTIGIGQRLSAQSIGWQDWPETAVQSDYISFANVPDALAEMDQSIARFAFFAGEPIRHQKLVQTEQGYMSAVLGPNMRGVSVVITAESASGGFIRPNDHVDVILSNPNQPDSAPQTILHNVRVLAINAQLGEVGPQSTEQDPDGMQVGILSKEAIATLELGATEAELLIGSATNGQISLALRSIVDVAKRKEATRPGVNEAIRLTSPFWRQTSDNGRPR